MKKFGLLCFIGLMILVLAACSGGGSKEAESAGKKSGKSKDEITLKFVHWINEENGKWEKVIKKYEEEHPGIKIESMPLVENMTHADYVKQLDLMASAGEQIDILMFSNINDLVKRVDAGLVAPIDQFLNDEGIDIDEVYNNSYPAIEGKYYGLPMKNVTNLVMMNKNHLDEAGLDIPKEWTWEDYAEYAKKLTTDDHYGSYLHIWHNFQSSLKLISKADNTIILKEDGSSNADDPMLKASLELRNQLENIDKSSVPLSEILSQNMNYRQQFFSQSVSMIPISSFMITEWGQFTPDFEIAWAPWPQNEPGDNYANMGGDIISIAENSEYKQEAYDFIRWMTTEGIVAQEVWTPSWKNADLDSVLETLVKNTANPEAVDLPSLSHALTSVQPSKSFAPATYITEVLTEFDAQVELYLLGEQDIDTTMKNIIDKTESIVKANK
ncbi:ABC transporter substrate-binding protein [Lederbergia citri]|uniref:Extracellular solute-binding protein n=1 Tax=Lederbergia citri TaxID=2833580 RepID=A0A942YHL2_9BACI|nr:extracellular solute-binding protein [Lederbergia citri]MBS4195919.1 extracellular solute-binding protein [Lederbergia citri]